MKAIYIFRDQISTHCSPAFDMFILRLGKYIDRDREFDEERQAGFMAMLDECRDSGNLNEECAEKIGERVIQMIAVAV